MWVSSVVFVLALVAVSAYPGAVAHAQSPPAAWDTTDPEELVRLIERSALTNNPAAARNIAAVLLRGVPPRVAASGLDALAALARPDGAEAVLRFLDHRRPGLRRHAIAAAGAIRTPAMVRALEARLGDPDPDVRADAAAVLGDVGGRESVAALWAALDRDLEASLRAEGGALGHNCAVAIARKGTADDVTRLLTYLRRAPFRTMADALLVALGRTDVPDPVKLQIVGRVGDLATRDARDLLTRYVEATRGRSPVVEAARTAASRIGE